MSQLTIRFPDRKSTRLNSSHLVISYAVFCLKKRGDNAAKLGVFWLNGGVGQGVLARGPGPAYYGGRPRKVTAGEVGQGYPSSAFFKCGPPHAVSICLPDPGLPD